MAKKVNYTGRDFNSLRENLVELGKQYFPNTFTNFNDFSPETMFIEMMAYVGDNLNFNIDEKFRNNFLEYADDIESVFRLAKEKGYKPQTVSVAVGNIELSQLVPSVDSGGEFIPDTSYCGMVKAGTRFSNVNSSSTYELIQDVDMGEYIVGSEEVVSTDGGGNPEFFRVYNTGKVRSGQKKLKSISVGNFEANLELFLDNNVAFIESIEDSEGNKWYEVDYISQDTIFEAIDNDITTDENFQYRDQTPYILKKRRVSRRFMVSHKSDGKCMIQFGSGVDEIDDTLGGITVDDLLSNNNIANYQLNNNFIVENFLNNDSMGLAPSNTSLTVTYVVSSGEEENAKANTITSISSPNIVFPNNVNSQVRNSFIVNNNEAVAGATFLNSIERIRTEAIQSYASQNRCVTLRDYVVRTKMLPNRFGNIDKVFARKNDNNNNINLYVLSKLNSQGISTCNALTKNNLKNYLSEFKMISDVINIRDPYIVNFGVYFEYVVRNGFNKDMVGEKLSNIVSEHFNIDKWEINQPIVIEDLRRKMLDVEGVINVQNIKFTNKFDESQGYSGISYNMSINGANYDRKLGVIYPPKDISIFEMKFPLRDITSKAI